MTVLNDAVNRIRAEKRTEDGDYVKQLELECGMLRDEVDEKDRLIKVLLNAVDGIYDIADSAQDAVREAYE